MPHRLCPLKQAALDAPRQSAWQDPKSSISFAELDQMAENFFQKLAKKNIRPGMRIAFLLKPSKELIALWFAAWRHGAAICPLNLHLPEQKIDEQLQRLSPHFFFPSLDLQNFAWKQSKAPLTPLEKASLFLFTSGSTGREKIAVLPLEQLLKSASSALSPLQFQPGDRWLLSLPLYHVAGIGLVLRALLGRGTVVFDARDPQITHLSQVPTQLYRAWPTYKKLKCLLLGGAPIASYPKELPIFLTYGLTEMGSLVLARYHPPQIEGRFYLGTPLPGREMTLASDGEIFVKGNTLFAGYWKEGQIECPLDARGWFATGDLGEKHPQEGFTMTGRKDWMFISGGENIQPEEIEQLLLSLPEVQEVAVVPFSDPEWGRKPVAFIQTNSPHFDLLSMQKALQPHLPPYKIPKALFLLKKLPKKGLKIDRKILLEMILKRP